MREKVLIKGAGEHSSGTAHRLFHCGYRVVMSDLPWPTAVRRKVSFCSAIFEREVVVEGIRAAGYALEDADPLIGDEIERVASWQGRKDVSQLAGQTVCMRIQLKDADVYSFRFR